MMKLNQILSRLALSLACAATFGSAQAAPAEEFPPQPPIPYLSPAESLAQFVFAEPGYSLELVLSEPEIKEPSICVFDGNGRMYIAEFRTYMQEIDGKNENAPISRVSVHWSSKKDGHYDKHAVFADNLNLPRMLLPLADGLLINETDTSAIYLYKDTDGDGVADKKELWLAGGPRGGNLEHQPSGLVWGLDNWIYLAAHSERFRLEGTNVVKEPTPGNGGQWGLTQDDFGKMWFVNAGGERGPINFQQPIIYGGFGAQGEFEPGFAEVWPLVGLGDVQGGPPRARPTDKTLNHFTATCGADVFRGDRLPADMRGNLLFAEPVGRLIRRTKIEVNEGVTILHNPYPKSEFLRSRDPNFRPINMVTAPDGSLYIVDMYRGIIQEGNWVREGSYLRKVVQQYSLDKNAGRGRIWRLVHRDFKPGPQPKMLDETPAQLVAHLNHPNGWWRDNAQRLLVLRGDKSVVPALVSMARTSANPMARIHALWTLEGLGALTPELLRVKFNDPDPNVRIAAVRAGETLCKQGDSALPPAVVKLARDPDPNVAIQCMMTASLLKWPNATNLVSDTMAANHARGVQEIGAQLLRPRQQRENYQYTEAQRKQLAKGERVYKELCFGCHGLNGKGAPIEGAAAGLTMAPPLAGSKTALGHRNGIINVLLHGLSGPIQNKTYDALMVPMASNDDEWIASVASYVRNNFGNRAPFISPEEVALQRAATADRAEPWTIDELYASLPQAVTNSKAWKLSASHGGAAAPMAIDGKIGTRYDTGASQTPGMWFQIEFPKEEEISGILLDAANSTGDYPRGYKVQLSADGQSWGAPVAAGKGNGPLTEINFPAAKAKFVRITQTGAVDGLFWSIHEMQVFHPAHPLPKLARKPQTKSDFE